MSTRPKSEIRDVTDTDINALKHILDSTGLFPSEALEPMISPFLKDDTCTDIWFAYTVVNVPIGFGYCVHEKLTDGTYNLLAIAVDESIQGKGIGAEMMSYLEARLRNDGKRILIVETSGDETYARTRRFYEKLGYKNAATIKDFWKEGEDKVTYYKKLNAP